MIIRKEVCDVLSANHYMQFEATTARWLSEEFPEDCALLGPNSVRVRMRDAIQVAGRYGFSGQRDATRFVYLWFLLGPHFDLNQDYGWLQSILKQPGDATAKMDLAFEQVTSHFEAGIVDLIE